MLLDLLMFCTKRQQIEFMLSQSVSINRVYLTYSLQQTTKRLKVSRIMCTEGICRPSIGRYYRPICRPTVGRYLDRYSGDMSAETRPSVGRHVV